MNRPHGPLTFAPAGALLLAVACSSVAVADDSKGPVSLFQPQKIQQQAYAAPSRHDAERAARPDRDGRSEPRTGAGNAGKPLYKQSAVVRRVQSSLTELGYDAGPLDGKMGPQTRSAIRDFQEERRQRADGEVTHGLMRAISAALADARSRTASAAAPSEAGESEAAQQDRPASARAADASAGTPRGAAEPEQRSERNTVERAKRQAAPAGGGLIGSAQAATPEEGALDQQERMAVSAQRADGGYGLDDAVAESWIIASELSIALYEEVETRIAAALD